MENNDFEEQIITQLREGHKTWTDLDQNLEMSSRTLSKYLMKLIKKGIIEKYGAVESDKIIDYYNLVIKKESEIVLSVPSIFEKPDFFYPVTKDLDIEQGMIEWFHYSLKVVMHLARKNIRC